MFIDFHTHIFPDKVAAKAVPKLADIIHLTPSMDGTCSGLESSMEDAGIDISVVLPTVTAPHQFDSVISFADRINEEFYRHSGHGFLSFAGVHPHEANYIEQLKLIKSMGFRGIKIHPDYQGTLFHDIRYKRILDKASELNLLVTTHTGLDVYSPDLIHCTVPMILEVLEDVHPTGLILAHMGNNEFYDDVERDLLGSDVWLDTAYSIASMEPKRLCRMIREHGAHRVLFGTDAPWTTQREDVKILSNLGLTDEELELVSCKNALQLLGL